MLTTETFDVFLSYKSRDRQWVKRLKTALEERGVSVWLDNDEIRPGTPFVTELEDALRRCKAVAFVLTPESYESQWVQREYHLAINLGIRIIPVVLNAADVEKIPGFMRSHHYVDFVDSSQFDESVRRLVWGIKDPPSADGESHLAVQPKVDAPEVASTRNSEFDPTTLHIIIAEDDADEAEYVKDFLEMELKKNWTLYKAKQIEFDIVVRRSLNSFKDQARLRLDQGSLVYAILDLRMPQDDGGPEGDVSEDIVGWCLDMREEIAQQRKFDFCCLSGSNDTLSRLFKDSSITEKLRKNSIKGVPKQPPSGIFQIAKDIKAFGYRNLRFCTIGDNSNRRVIWFGDDGQNRQLLGLAEKFSNKREGGVNLIFSDAAGYELDWFHLVCGLRGVKPKILNCYVEKTEADDWQAYLRDPPPALFIGGTDRLDEKGFDILSAIKEFDFFAKVEDSKSLVFIQFPFIESELSIRDVLDCHFEQPFLDQCLHHIGAKPEEECGEESLEGFAFPNHPSILRFPSYAEIRAAGTARKIIAFQSERMQHQLNLVGTSIDEEAVELLAQQPWDDRKIVGWDDYGLRMLRRTIRQAYRRFARDAASSGSSSRNSVTKEMFTSLARNRDDGYFRKRSAFRVSGSWNYNQLEREGPLDDNVQDLTAAESLAQLERIHVLFHRLSEIVELRKELSSESATLFDRDTFPEWQFRSLADVHDFLRVVFVSPARLSERIETFRPHVNSRSWRKHYPRLEKADWWRVVAENAKQWPFDRLPMHSDVHAFLTENRINTRVNGEIHRVLGCHPDLANRWHDVELIHKNIIAEIQEREEERLVAEHFIRDSKQPLPERLDHQPEPNLDQVEYERLLEEFLMITSGLAICENCYHFDGRHLSPEQMAEAFRRPNLVDNATYVSGYAEGILRAGESDVSFLQKWRDDWPKRFGQAHSIRLAQQIAESLLSHRGDPGRESIFKVVGELEPERGVFPTSMVIEFLLGLNEYAPSFWASHGNDVLEFLRRFIAATTHSFRIGWFDEDSRQVCLWTLDERESIDWPETMERLESDEFYAFAEVGPSRVAPMFPLPCLRIHPNDASVWVHAKNDWWRNLNYRTDGQEQSEMHAENADWLLSQEELLRRLNIKDS